MQQLHPDFFGAPTPVNPDARDRDEFVGWIVDRYLAKSGIDRDTARDFADASMGELPPFGHPDCAWTQDAAYDLADEDMECWEDE